MVFTTSNNFIIVAEIEEGNFFQKTFCIVGTNGLITLIASYTRATADDFLRGIAYNYM